MPDYMSTLIPALAALCGSLVGGVTSFASTYFDHRHQGRRERLLTELTKREALYGQFVDEAVAMYVDSLDRTLDQPARVIGLFATIARIRLIGSPEVLEVAENVGRDVLASYGSPRMTAEEFLRSREGAAFEPFKAFTLACRKELNALHDEL